VGWGILTLAGAQAVWWWEPVGLFAVLERVTPDVVWRVPTAAPLVALSFDDGPSALHTPRVLALLAEHDAHATFFLIGERAASYPDVVRAIRAGGHEIGNHYLRNGTALTDGAARFEANLLRTEAILDLGEPKLFRPPGGLAWPAQLRRARELGYTVALGSAYPHDPAHPPARYIEWLVEKNMVPGAIVILHDGIPDPSRSIEALPGILAEGRRRGLRFVTIGRLLEQRPGRRPGEPGAP
jgi:peptidoglycan/xylan/chitin deacetylase (PgdA/CDA1 family)